MKRVCGLGIIVLAIACSAMAQDMRGNVGRSLFADPKAARAGDAVMVLVVETSSASNDASTTSDGESNLSLSASGKVSTSNIPEVSLGVGTGNSFKGSGATSTRGSIRAKISARVDSVLANGDLVITGHRTITVNGEEQRITLSGIVRPPDILADNSVYSYNIAEARIAFEGNGVVSSAQGTRVDHETVALAFLKEAGMERNVRGFVLALAVVLAGAGAAGGAIRIKDIAHIQGIRGQQIIGYGLVVGLNGTGDTQRSTFTLQSVASMLKRFGINVPQNDLRLRNVAAVMVTATVPGFTKEGSEVDVIVSSMGDATSLQGGTLLITPLSGIDGVVYVMAQGPLSVGGMSVRSNGNEIRRNHTAAGRIPGGGVVEKTPEAAISKDSTISVVLMEPDFTTATRVADAVNTKLGQRAARAQDGASISILVPEAIRAEGRLVEFISSLEGLEVTPDVVAKVVINERTGTIVVGGTVSIMSVAISHGGLNIEIESIPMVSQPAPFSQGQTVTTQLTAVYAGQDTSTVQAFDGTATVQDVAKTLNALKVTPRDIIAIFQALKRAGALNAELVII